MGNYSEKHRSMRPAEPLDQSTACSMSPVTCSRLTYAALQAAGPWEDVGNGPWAPRAGAALITNYPGTQAILASGISFCSGVPCAPTFGDVWGIDVSCQLQHWREINGTAESTSCLMQAHPLLDCTYEPSVASLFFIAGWLQVSVCLLNRGNGQVCGGPSQGTPDLDNVKCNCLPGYGGRACDAPSPTASATATGSASASTGYTFSSTATGSASATQGPASASMSSSASATATATPTGSPGASPSQTSTSSE